MTQNDNNEGSKKQQQEMTPHTTEGRVSLGGEIERDSKEKDLVGEKMKTMKTEHKADTNKMYNLPAK